MFTYLNQSTPIRAKVPFTVADQQLALSSGVAQLKPKLEVKDNDDEYTDVQREQSLMEHANLLTATEMKDLKFNMQAIPAGLLRGVKGNSKGKGGKSGKNLKTIVSRTYNPSASRPLKRSRMTEQIYRAEMRYDVISFVSTSITVPVFVGRAFQLSDFSNYTEYTGLFDQYMFEEIEIWLEPTAAPGVATTNLGLLTTAVDVDDSATPTTFATVEDKQTSLTATGINGHYHRWKPNLASAVYGGSLFNAFASVPAEWVDCGSPNAQHYGLKAASTATSAVITYNLSVRARILFKQAGI